MENVVYIEETRYACDSWFINDSDALLFIGVMVRVVASKSFVLLIRFEDITLFYSFFSDNFVFAIGQFNFLG